VILNGLNINQRGFLIMIKYKYYRMIQVILGSRSFVKTNQDGTKTYLLIKGPQINAIIEKWIADGYIEEWPLDARSNA
jgi:hypothetical protein